MVRTALVSALLVGVSGTAMASGFALRENSATTMGTGFAGMGSRADDLSIIFNNPAGMTHLSGNQAQATGTLIVPSMQYKGGGTSLMGTVPTGGSDGTDAGGPAGAPAAYGFFDASPDLKFGIAVTAPFGLSTRYEQGWAGRYLAVNSEVAAIDVNPNVAYRVNRFLSIGGGLSAQYFRADFDQAINTSALFGGAPGTVLPDGYGRFKGDSLAWGYNAGVMLEPAAGTRLGLSYRSRIEHHLEGRTTFDVPAPLAGVPSLASGASEAELVVPDNVLLSLTQEVTPSLNASFDLQWTNWSTVKNLTTRRTGTSAVISDSIYSFHNTVFVAAGAAYKLDDRWTLRAGTHYDQSPVRDEVRTVSLPDSDRVGLSFGAGYAFSDAFSVDVGYTHLFLLGGDLSKSVNAVSATGDRLDGRIDVHADEFAMSARVRF